MPTLADTKQQRCIDEWNRVYGVGQRVEWLRDDGTLFVTTTRSAAFLHNLDGAPAILLNGTNEPVPLGDAQPVP